jgi:enolase
MTTPRITHVASREVLDSRGRPTVEVDVRCGDLLGRAIVPSGASTGRAEARELRDGDPQRYSGQGVLRAVRNVNEIAGPAVLGLDPRQQRELDARLIELDGTPDKRALGANAVLGVSLAAAHAAAAVDRLPLYQHLRRLWQSHLALPAGPLALPLPMVNMISGGLHAGANLDVQDFLIVPHGAGDYPQQLEWTARVVAALSRRLIAAGFEGRLLADEGGFGPRLSSNGQALDLLVGAIESAGLQPGRDVSLALDVAASHFFDGRGYVLAADAGRVLSGRELVDWLEAWVEKYPIRSIEDGAAEDDETTWAELTRRLGGRVTLIGDDLLATNPARLAAARQHGWGNGALVKLNQIGTVSETLEFMAAAAGAGWLRVVSARSGETEDTTIADLAVATGAEMIKIGSIHHGERLAKYNRLLRIGEELAAAR